MQGDAERAVALLRYANFSKVAEALLVSRAAVADWAKGRSVTPYRLNQLQQLLRPDLEAKEAAPPEWAERLAGQLKDEVQENRRVIEAYVQQQTVRATAELRGLMDEYLREIEQRTPQPDEDPVANGSSRDAAASGRRRAAR